MTTLKGLLWHRLHSQRCLFFVLKTGKWFYNCSFESNFSFDRFGGYIEYCCINAVKTKWVFVFAWKLWGFHFDTFTFHDMILTHSFLLWQGAQNIPSSETSVDFSLQCHMVYLQVGQPYRTYAMINIMLICNFNCKVSTLIYNLSGHHLLQCCWRSSLVREETRLMCRSSLDTLGCLLFLASGGLVRYPKSPFFLCPSKIVCLRGILLQMLELV